MRKKLFVIFCIIIFIISTGGCAEKNTTDKSIREIEQNKSQSSTVISENKQISKENSSLEDYLTQKDKLFFVGKIKNDLDIHMELQFTNKDYFNDISDLYYNSSTTMVGDDVVARYEGNYYYDKYKKNIRIEAQLYSNGYFNIYEFDERNGFNGSFGGFIYQGKSLKGMWSDKDGSPKYQFYLIKNDTKIDGLDLKLDTDRIGNYSRTGSSADDSTCLIINTTSNEKFKFHISGYSKPNMGNVGGIAFYIDSSKKNAEFYDKKSNLKITFNFEGKTVKITGNDVLSKYGGAHVTLDGIFEKLINN